MQKNKTKKLNLVLGIVMSCLSVLSITSSTFAYWQKQQKSFYIPTDSFNATEEEFTYYACVPNVVSTTGYDYYDLENIPIDLTDRVTGLAVVRFEALTKTAYIPSYPSINVGGRRFNFNNAKELPVIHILNSLTSGETEINNGFSKIETLIIPETVTYIQPESFVNSTSLKEVSILGKEDNSGYINFSETKFTALDSTNDLHYENRTHRTTNPYTLDANYSYRNKQFNGNFEYDNLTGNYFTYVITGGVAQQDVTINESLSADFLANTKYKLTISKDENDLLSLTSEAYTYKLRNASNEDINLVLNNSIHYEEYILQDNMGTMRIDNYPLIHVDEYIDGDVNSSVLSSFQLNKLNASYSSDNNCFEIKYAPSYAYESIHYYNEGEDLIEEKTYTQISVEKAYFINNVQKKDTEIDGEEFIEITTPFDESYGQLYIRGGYSTNVGTYYTDLSQNTTYIEMELVNNNYRYEFRESLSPVANTLPDTFVFHKSKTQIVGYPSYVSTYETEDEIQDALATETYGTKRIYLEMYSSTDVSWTEELIKTDHSQDNKGNKYVWYVVYWYKEGGVEQQHKLKMHYADSKSTFMIVDIPTYAQEFKFIRMTTEVEKNLDTYLELGNSDWSHFTNYSIENLKLSSYNRYWFEKWGEDEPYKNQFSVTNGSNLESNKKYDLRNKNYLVLENYGEVGKTKYIPLQENLGYSAKDVHADDQFKEGDGFYNLEFTTYAEYQEKSLQRIALPAGTIVSARILDINKAEDTYFTNLLKYVDGKVSARDNSGAIPGENFDESTLATYFTKDANDNLVVLKDLTAEIYLETSYDATSPYNENLNLSECGWRFDIKSENVSGFQTRLVADESKSGEVSIIANIDETLSKGEYNTSNREIGAVFYPGLKQTGTVYKLNRNYANTSFEEYRYFSNSSLAGNYVISSFYENNIDFGGLTGNTYYGTINGTTPSGELIVTNENIIMFTPDGDNSFEDRYYAAFDDYGNFLTFLSFNRTQTVKEGYQCLSFTIPDILSDFRNVEVYEVDSEGNIIGDKINLTTAILDIVDDYNDKYGYDEDINGDKVHNDNFVEIIVPEENDPKLLFDYYLRQLGGSVDNDDKESNPQYRTNNIGFSYGIDENGDILYYYDNIKLAISSALNSSERYQIFTRTNYSKGITLYNNDEEYALDEQIIDGYYYNDITITGKYVNTIRFMDDKFKDGYYDLVLRERDGKYYLGYKYLGIENTHDYDYYLYMYEYDSSTSTIGDLVDIYKMDSMNNGNHYFADICYEGTVAFKVYSDQKVLMGTYEGYTLSSLDKVSRFYYGVNTPVDMLDNDEDGVEETEVYLKQLELDKIGININFGSHPNDQSNIRYTPTLYNSDLDYYQVKVNAALAENIYYADSSEGASTILSKSGSSYIGYMFTTTFNATIQIKKNSSNIENKTLVLPHPGNYSISYNEETGVVSCYRVQDPDLFHLLIDGEEIAELEVNNQNKYYEYVVKKHIVLEEPLNFSTSVITVTDYKDNLLSTIEDVTLTRTIDELVAKESVKVIPAGVYSLTYSVDSSRREGDKYLVFTYLNFTEIPSNTVTYHYKDNNEEDATITKQVVSDINWEFELIDYESLTSYLPVGKYFEGWSYESNGDPIETDTISTTENIDLYPVFYERVLKHPVIWLSDLSFDSTSDIIFTLGNLDDYHVASVSYEGYESAITKYVSIDTTNSNRIVTIKPALFEVIGYVEGGIPLIVNLDSQLPNGKDVKVKVLIPYPNYSNEFPLFSSYYSSFSSSEYNNMTQFATTETDATDLVKAINGSSITWRLNNARIGKDNSYGEISDNNLNLIIKGVSGVGGYAITDNMFSNISNLSFQFRSKTSSTMTMDVIFLDYENNSSKTINVTSAAENGVYGFVSLDVKLEGIHRIKFEIIGAAKECIINIDNLLINCSSDLTSDYYFSSFTSGEYAPMNSYSVGNDINALTSAATGWTNVNNAMVSKTNSYGNEDESNQDNLCLRLKAVKNNEGTQVPATAKTTKVFNNLQSIDFDLRAESGKMQLDVYIYKSPESGGGIVSTTTITNFVAEKYSHIHIDLSTAGLTGEYVIVFSAQNTGSAQENVMCIDNLIIKYGA